MSRLAQKHSILCVNSGSSSLKCALYHMGGGEEVQLIEGAVERIGLDDGCLWIRNAKKEMLKRIRKDFVEHGQAVEATFVVLEELRFPEPDAVGSYSL